MNIRSSLFVIPKRLFNTDSLSSSIIMPLEKGSSLTRIRIWKSGYFAKDGTFYHSPVPYSFLKSNIGYKEGNIGHVSVETGEFYASFWPRYLTFFNKLYIQEGEHSNISEDYRSEKRIHTHLIDLETLDISSMASELKKFKATNQYWLFGPSTIMANNAASCSGLAYALLKAGGIGKLVSPGFTVRDQLIATPNNLSKLVLLAKAKEEELLKDKNKSETTAENTTNSFKR